ncbi:MAG: hypothetical protein JWQ20_2697 [Conexibacter sp.]|nr:hypothetical protein [Conexibacter sp.]
MSSQPPDAAGTGPAPGPSRRVVATYDSYPEAERAVDYLADKRFPVERVSIVGRDLKLVEQVVGRMTLARSVLSGLLSGALIGVLIGWLFAVFNWFDPVVARGWLILDALWFGAVAGAIFGLITHLLTGGRRDFSSVGGLQADHYDLLVDEEVADEAARTLAGLAAEPAPGEPRFSRAEREARSR